MYEPLISIIVPVYKVEKYIHRCIESVLHQTYTNWELILVDDGSPNSCGRICDEYAMSHDKIAVIHKINQGNGILSPKQEAEVKTYLSLHKEIPLSDKKEWQRTCIIENKYKGFMCIVGRLYRIVFNMRNKIRSRKINRHVQK